MPRRSAKNDNPDLLNDGPPLMMLPPARTAHKHEREVNAYESPPGAVPHIIKSEPLKRKLTDAEKAAQIETRKEHKFLATRHARYLDLLIEHKGDRELALAVIFDKSADDVRVELLDLLAEVRRGLAVSPLGELLERGGLDLAGRVNILTKHAYSDNPAASLKAIDLASEMAGTTANEGSFESFLRISKAAKGK